MFASTNLLVAGPPPPGPLLPDVDLVTSVELAPEAKCQLAVAFAVNVPAVLLLIVTVHVRVLPLPCGTHADWLSGAGETVTCSEFSDGVVPDGVAVVVMVNV